MVEIIDIFALIFIIGVGLVDVIAFVMFLMKKVTFSKFANIALKATLITVMLLMARQTMIFLIGVT